jgi:glycerol-3-phosphate dehydrogenase (NAD(P)+)
VADRLRITVIGGGAWGTSLAALSRQDHHQVTVWSRNSSQSLAEAVVDADLMICAIAMKGVRSIIQHLQSLTIPTSTIIVTATKGLSLEGLDDTRTSGVAHPDSIRTPSQLWSAAFPHHAIAVLSGPNLSKEIDHGLPAASVVASRDEHTAKTVQHALSSATFRVYTNADPIGVELGGALKNVMAIAAGTCDGLQLGTNAKAALMTRGLAEMIRISRYWNAQPETFYGLAGMGDLLATCNSALSRNYQVGYQLAQGQSLSDILANLSGTAEGINTSNVLMQLAPNPAVTIPITYQVVQLLRQVTTPREAVATLMLRDVRPEF